MEDEGKTKNQLIDELRLLRRELAEGRRREEDHKRDNAALKESVERFRTALNQSNDGIIISRGDQRLFVNQKCLDLLGYSSAEELAGRPLFFAVHPDDRESLIKAEESRQEGRPAHSALDVRMVKKDGSVIHVMGSAVMITYENQPASLLIFRDVTRRKDVEKALRESEERYRLITDNMSDMIRFTDISGTNQYVSPSHKKGLGYDPESRLGRNVMEFVHPEDLERVQVTFMNALASHSPATVEYRFRNAEGRYIWLETVGDFVFDQDGQIKGGVFCSRDITDRKRAENALRVSEERYRTILEEMEDGYQEVDLAGNFVFFNESFRKIFGYSRDEMMDTNYRRYAADAETADNIYRAFNQLYKTGEPIKRCEWDILTKDGVRRTLEIYASLLRDPEGHPSGFRGIVRDVTDRRLAEEQYRTMANNSQVGVYIVQGGRIQFANPHISRYSGYGEDELVGARILNFVHPEDRQAVREKAARMLRRETSAPYEYRIIDKKGRTRWLMETVTAISYGGKRAVLGNTMDVTERRGAEEEKRLLESQFLQAQKMEAVGTLAGGVAHDFNNLLMGIQGYTSLMLLDTDVSHPYYEKLKSIEDQVRSGADLTRQLLGFARGGKYEVRPADLNEVIERTSTMFGRTKKEIRIHRKYESSLWSVEVDQGQIEQVLLNLYVNAWQAMPGGGELYLETQNVMLGEDYRLSFAVVPGGYVKVSVTDTGVGMDAKTQERIFEPFFTTKEMGRGTGLGLATVYGIIKGHKGIINVYSEKGRGTTFTIYLPASGRGVVGESDRRYFGEPLRGHETILLIDDEAVILEVTGEILESLGYRVLTAGSGPEALEMYRRGRDRIDLVILDMIMPGMGGGETFDHLRAMNPEVKVILSSGYSLNGEAYGILERGCRAFIQKPFSVPAVSRKIREVLESERA